MLSSNEDKLSKIIEFFEGNGEKGFDGSFPTKEKLDRYDVVVSIIVEQAKKLLEHKESVGFMSSEFDLEDKDFLIDFFLSDIKQFITEFNVKIPDEFIMYFSQKIIHNHAFFHLARSSLLPNAYKTIDLLTSKSVYDTYSIPFKIRVAIENKLKYIVGFKSCDVEINGRTIRNSKEFPFSALVRELIKLNCLDTPCSLRDLLNVYSWSCNFCHTGEKEYIWMLLKSIEVISPLFLYFDQKNHEINVVDLWKDKNLSEEEIINDMTSYQGFLNPVYYFKDDFSVQKLQAHLNSLEKGKLSSYKFYLSETMFDDVSFFYCSKTKKYY